MLIVDGFAVDIPGMCIKSWRDSPKLGLSRLDYKVRPNTWIRGIVLHTTKGIPGGRDKRPQKILPGLGPDTKRDERLARMWSMDTRRAGAHIAVDHDGSVVCMADLKASAAFHAGNVNDVTIGIEIYQGSQAELYEGQLDVVVRLVNVLTSVFRIQRQVPWPYEGRALKRGLRRGIDMVGVYGHRDCSNNRGAGDPGDAVMQKLIDSGYDSFNFAENEDKDVWRDRQRDLGVLEDGVPGPKTCEALVEAGYSLGLWVCDVVDPGCGVESGVECHCCKIIGDSSGKED